MASTTRPDPVHPDPVHAAPAAEPGRGPGRLGDRPVWWAAFALFSLMGAIWALSAPMLTGPDEFAHAGKAAAVAHGELTWVDRYEIEGSGADDPTRVETWVVMPRPYTELDYQCIALPPLRPASCMGPLPADSDEEVAGINSAAAYPPAFYAAVGWPSLLLGPSKALYAMRAVQVLAAAAFLASAVVAARRADVSGTMLVGVAAAVTPMVMFLAATVNPSGIETAVAVAVWCAGLEVTARRDRVPTRALLRLFVACGAMVLIRPLSIAMLAVVVGVVVLSAARWERVRALLGDRRVWVGLVGFGAAVAFALFWLAYAEPQSTFWGAPSDLSTTEAARFSLEQFPYRTRQMIGYFGWVDSPATLHVAGIVAWLAVVAALVVAALVVGTNRQRLGVLAAVAATVVVPVASETMQAAEVGFIWQGRYGLPIAVGVPILAGWVAGTSGRLTAGLRRVAIPLAVGLLATISVVAWMTMMRRFVIGDPSPLVAFLDRGSWAPRWVPKPALFVLTALTAAVTAAMYVLAGRAEHASELSD